MNSDTRKLLEAVQQGAMSVDGALLALKKEPFTDIGYAKVDMHRGIRQGAAEVIYGAGKTAAQMIGIVGVMRQHGQKTILITRLSPESAAEIAAGYPWITGPRPGAASSATCRSLTASVASLSLPAAPAISP